MSFIRVELYTSKQKYPPYLLEGHCCHSNGSFVTLWKKWTLLIDVVLYTYHK